MATAPIIIDLNKCKGCTKCVKACPFDALEMVNKKASLTGDCRACNTCVNTCPFGAISTAPKEKKAIDLSSFKDIWVFAEQRNGVIQDVALELLAEGRKLAESRKCDLCAVLLGYKLGNLPQTLIEHGADKVYVLDDEKLAEYETYVYADALYKLLEKYKPESILAGATTIGRGFFPKVAVRAHAGLTADCTNLAIDPQTHLLLQTRPAFGGNIMATIMTPDHRPQFSTVRPRVFRKGTPDSSRKGMTILEQFELVAHKLKTIKSIPRDTGGDDIAGADIIVAGGKGMVKAENFALLKELADLLGGTVAASRACVDAGWVPVSRQVGQTGKTVCPQVYLAFGISGAIQHLAGMTGSDYIVSVNKDSKAPIFGVSNLGIVGDVMEVLPALIEAVKENK